jgi:hypothetical protein
MHNRCDNHVQVYNREMNMETRIKVFTFHGLSVKPTIKMTDVSFDMKMIKKRQQSCKKMVLHTVLYQSKLDCIFFSFSVAYFMTPSIARLHDAE